VRSPSAPVAVEGRDEAVVAELEMRGSVCGSQEKFDRLALETSPGLSISKPAGSRS
jgi:hypothetical protein